MLLPPQTKSICGTMLALCVLLMQLVAPGAAAESIAEQFRAARLSMCRALCAKNPGMCATDGFKSRSAYAGGVIVIYADFSGLQGSCMPFLVCVSPDPH